jgi:hypothetical protein
MDMRNRSSINDALLTLIPKSVEAKCVKDYHPISWTHCLGRLFSKVLAMRMALRLPSLVHGSHSAFIRGHFIQDNFRYVQSSTKLLHNHKRPCLLLKVDISRTFDSVAWPFLLELLHHMGFPAIWMDWVASLLTTASTRATVNECLTPKIWHAHGLCQGDPLSPMLFFLLMEALSAIIRKADDWLLLQPLHLSAIPH